MEGLSLSLKKGSFLIITILTVAADQITKALILEYIRYYESIRLLPFFQIVNVKNTGAAFGLLRSLGNTFFIILSIIAIIFIIYLLLRDDADPLPLSLILGGAIGNLIDRLRLGYVVDFLDFHIGEHHWPAFNLADSALTIGIGLLFLRMLLSGRERTKIS
jgi:signal peptidase II